MNAVTSGCQKSSNEKIHMHDSFRCVRPTHATDTIMSHPGGRNMCENARISNSFASTKLKLLRNSILYDGCVKITERWLHMDRLGISCIFVFISIYFCIIHQKKCSSIRQSDQLNSFHSSMIQFSGVSSSPAARCWPWVNVKQYRRTATNRPSSSGRLCISKFVTRDETDVSGETLHRTRRSGRDNAINN